MRSSSVPGPTDAFMSSSANGVFVSQGTAAARDVPRAVIISACHCGPARSDITHVANVIIVGLPPHRHWVAITELSHLLVTWRRQGAQIPASGKMLMGASVDDTGSLRGNRGR
jgi:hypothetical protein